MFISCGGSFERVSADNSGEPSVIEPWPAYDDLDIRPRLVTNRLFTTRSGGIDRPVIVEDNVWIRLGATVVTGVRNEKEQW